MIEINNIKKSFEDQTLFEGFSTTIYYGEKIGIIGKNGAGKTTFLNVIANAEILDEGFINLYDYKIGYLKQATFYNDIDLNILLNDKSLIDDFLRHLSIFQFNNEIDVFKTSWDKFSFGERTKILLSYILALNPDILLLDEPTNHLDLEGIKSLIKILNSSAQTILCVSHDRFFLNNIVEKIFEVVSGKINIYDGNYDKYVVQKQIEAKSIKNIYEKQQKYEHKINENIARLSSWSTKGEKEASKQGGSPSDHRIMGAYTSAQTSASKLAKQAKAKISKLEQIKKTFIDKPKEEKNIHYNLVSQKTGSKVLINIETLEKSFSELLFKDVNIQVFNGDKVALIGNNGTGKTTLLKLIMGEDTDYLGKIEKSSSLKIAYLTQDVFNLNEDETVFSIASKKDEKYKNNFLVNLINMGISNQVFHRKIKTLSLGERMKIKMCEIILSDYHLLILDEPTNHLDLENKIFMEKVLKDYKGSFIITSHDLSLLKNVCNKAYIIKDKHILDISLNDI